MIGLLEMESEQNDAVREFVCKLIMTVFLELRDMAEFPDTYDNNSERGFGRPWTESNMRQIYICIYDMPEESLENRKSVFRSLTEKYCLRLNYSMIYGKLDPMYRKALVKANEKREMRSLPPYPEAGSGN